MADELGIVKIDQMVIQDTLNILSKVVSYMTKIDQANNIVDGNNEDVKYSHLTNLVITLEKSLSEAMNKATLEE